MQTIPKITNELGMRIPTILLGISNVYYPPKLSIDTLQEKHKTPNIKVSEDINILNEIDFILYAKPITKKMAWARRQRFILYLRPEESPVEPSYKQIKYLPANHYLEIDTANFRIRLVGPFVDPMKVGPWLEY